MSLTTSNPLGEDDLQPASVTPAPPMKPQPERPVQPLAPDARGVKDHRLIHRFLSAFDFCLVWLSAVIVRELFVLLDRLAQAKAPAQFFGPQKIGALLLFSLLTVLFMQAQREYALFWKQSVEKETRRLSYAIVAAAVVARLSMYLFGATLEAETWMLLVVALSWALLAAWRKLLRSQTIAGLTEKKNVVIVGCGPNGKILRDHVESHPELGYVFRGYLDRRMNGKRPNPERNKEEGFILGPVENLEVIVRERFIDEVLVSVPTDRYLVRRVARAARKAGVPVRVVPDLYDGLAMGQQFEYVGQFPTLTIHQRSNPTFQLILKRLLDLAVSAVALTFLSPILVLIAAAVKLDSKGAALYESDRVGKKGNTFVCYKFRTMTEKADEQQEALAHLNERQGLLFKMSNDPRVTRVGRFLRKYSLDELPQLWNVLKGDMSLVGPRPPLPREYSKYALDHLCRLDVTPGVTGLWQVSARQDPSFENYIELDKNYVNNWSFWLDCQILWKTIGVVIGGTGQ